MAALFLPVGLIKGGLGCFVPYNRMHKLLQRNNQNKLVVQTRGIVGHYIYPGRDHIICPTMYYDNKLFLKSKTAMERIDR